MNSPRFDRFYQRAWDTMWSLSISSPCAARLNALLWDCSQKKCGESDPIQAGSIVQYVRTTGDACNVPCQYMAERFPR